MSNLSTGISLPSLTSSRGMSSKGVCMLIISESVDELVHLLGQLMVPVTFDREVRLTFLMFDPLYLP